MADRALVVGCMELALGVAKEGQLARAAVRRRSCGEFVLCGSAQIICADDDHAKYIALTFTGNQVGFEQARCVGRCFQPLSQLSQGFWKARIRLAVRLDRYCNRLKAGKSIAFVVADCGSVPLDFERWKIQKQHAE